ncbi:hypothetical protein J6590_020268 [Homalodisca vitripennis]|nr:hypothetical protein J6590_020268 [Homalodisca vitripennis]
MAESVKMARKVIISSPPANYAEHNSATYAPRHYAIIIRSCNYRQGSDTHKLTALGKFQGFWPITLFGLSI